jgi:hypothetical protein
VLDAQRSLVEAKKNYVELLKTLRCSVANLARLCSIHFHGSDGEMFEVAEMRFGPAPAVLHQKNIHSVALSIVSEHNS